MCEGHEEDNCNYVRLIYGPCIICELKNFNQPCFQGLSSLPPLVVGTETLVAAGHVTIYPSKTAGWVGT